MNKTLATIFENKRLWATIGVIALLIMIGIANIMGSNQREISLDNKQPEERYEVKKERVIYIRNKTLVKINFLEKYTECNDSTTKTNRVCSDVERTITSYQYLNDEALKTYKDITIADNADLTSTIINLVKQAQAQKIDFSYVELIADWNAINDYKDLLIDEMNSDSPTFVATFMDHIVEEDLLQENEAKVFTVTFDSRGGSKINSQSILEHGFVSVPHNPTRNNYEFVEWQLNGKKYNFQQEVLSDITLVAIWKENVTTTKEEDIKTEPVDNQDEQTEKPVSTIDNINLNDNIYVRKVTEASDGYLFGTNIASLFSSYLNGQKLNRNNLTDDEYDNLYAQINFDEVAYSTLKNKFDNLQGKSYAGVSNFNYAIDNHRISYNITYLQMKDDIALKNSFNGLSNTIKNDISSLLSKAYHFGSNKNNNQDYEILNENLCQEFHLTCNRF